VIDRGQTLCLLQASSKDDNGTLCRDRIDVSFESLSICVVDASGQIMPEAKIASEPEALAAWFKGLGFELSRIGLARCRNDFMRE
jgi:hypothetical protein